MGDNQYGEQNHKDKQNEIDETMKTYADYLTYINSLPYTKATIINKTYSVKTILPFLQDNTINKDNVERWRRWAQKHYSRNAYNNRINSINDYLRYTDHPDLQIKHVGMEETNQTVLREDEYQRYEQKSHEHPETHLMSLLLFDGLLRPNSIYRLRLTDKDGDILWLDKTKTGDKHIIMSERLQDSWSRYVYFYRPIPKPEYKDMLFIKNLTYRGTAYTSPKILQARVLDCANAAGIKKRVNPYVIRRTSMTLRQDKNSQYYAGDSKIVMLMANHSDIRITKRYDVRDDNDIRTYLQSIHVPVKPLNVPVNTQNTTPSHGSKPKKLVPWQTNDLNNYGCDDGDNTTVTISFLLNKNHMGGESETTFLLPSIFDWLSLYISPPASLITSSWDTETLAKTQEYILVSDPNTFYNNDQGDLQTEDIIVSLPASVWTHSGMSEYFLLDVDGSVFEWSRHPTAPPIVTGEKNRTILLNSLDAQYNGLEIDETLTATNYGLTSVCQPPKKDDIQKCMSLDLNNKNLGGAVWQTIKTSMYVMLRYVVVSCYSHCFFYSSLLILKPYDITHSMLCYPWGDVF